MKIRSGFVSNSSSSSFVVRAHEAVYRKNGKFLRYKKTITAKQEKTLTLFGFFKTFAHSPYQVVVSPEERKQEEESVNQEISEGYSNFNYGYDVTCNQDDVVRFLLLNKIPFVASEHYGHRHVFYDKKTDKVTVAINFGEILSTYGVVEGTDTSDPIQTFTRKQYLKQVTY